MSSRTPLRLSALAFRPRQPHHIARAQGVRSYADDSFHGRMQKDTSGGDKSMEQLPHVSEEAAATSSVTGDQGPELEQGSKISDVC